jgi:RNA polymerase sigma-70 factor, ECF subfamily
MADPGRKRAEFAEWAIPHMDHVYTAARYLTRSPEEAEELLQETYLRAYRFWHQFTVGTNCRAWLMTILHNIFRNRYRNHAREQRTVEFDDRVAEQHDAARAERTEDNPEELVLSQLLDGEVEEALTRLPAEFLEVVLLVDVHELTYEEAAAALSCPIGTVRSRLARGRRLLQTLLHDYAAARGYLRRDRYALR